MPNQIAKPIKLAPQIQKVDESNFTIEVPQTISYNIDQLTAQRSDLQKRIDDIDAILSAATDTGIKAAIAE